MCFMPCLKGGHCIAHNGFTLGEGGDFNHKCQCGERMLNIAVNVERSTEPTLLPNVCYAIVLLLTLNINKYE